MVAEQKFRNYAKKKLKYCKDLESFAQQCPLTKQLGPAVRISNSQHNEVLADNYTTLSFIPISKASGATL